MGGSSLGNVAVVPIRAVFRGMSGAGLPPVVFMQGTTTPLDGGQGFYAANYADRSTPDNGSSVIVTTDGTRFELVSADTGAQIMAALIASGDVTPDVAVWLADPSSANLEAAQTDLTGTGLLVFNDSPALVTPDLGTPSALVLTNATGLPVAGGGTGVATLTANGVIYGDGTDPVGITAQGAAGTVLTGNGASPPSFTAQGSVPLALVTPATTYPILADDYYVICITTAFTATLPTAVGQTGRARVIKNANTVASGNVITVATTGGQLIDGAATAVLNPLQSITVVSDGANWWIV